MDDEKDYQRLVDILQEMRLYVILDSLCESPNLFLLTFHTS